jgi:hypothetical protein
LVVLRKAFAFALLLLPVAAQAQNTLSGTMIEPGCKAVVSRTRPPDDFVSGANYGLCEGTVSTVLLLASSLKDPARICRPNEATVAHADSDEVAPAYRDDLAPGFRHDVAPWAGAAGDGIVGAEPAFVNVLLI